MKSIILLFTIHCSLFTVHCFSQDSAKAKTWTINGYLKDMQSFSFVNLEGKWEKENLIHNRLNLKLYIIKDLKLVIEDRNRILFSRFLEDIPGYKESFEADNGIVKLSKNLIDDRAYIFNTSVDRAYINYTKDKIELTLGRQRINWGQTFVWNPNDIFNIYSYFDFDYEERPGSDALRMQYFFNPTDKAEVAVKANNDRQITAAGLYKFNRWKYDFQFLAGILNDDDIVVGAGWAGEIVKGGFRGEISYFIDRHSLKSGAGLNGIFVGSVGYDYTFKNSLFLQFEMLYNSNKKESNTGLNLSQLENNNALSPRNPFLSGASFFCSGSYPVTPLFTCSISGIYNPDYKIYFIIPMLTYSVTDNIDLSAISQSFKSFSDELFKANGNYIFIRLKWSF